MSFDFNYNTFHRNTEMAKNIILLIYENIKIADI